MTPRLRLENLTVRYPGATRPALEAATLEVGSGERVAVIGESGSGKSTLALAAAGLLPAGTAVAGVANWPERGAAPRPGRDFGFVFQDAGASLDPVMAVGAQVAEVVRTHHSIGKAEAREMATGLLARAGLPDPPALFRAYPHQLSGGQRQRVAIATAIAGRPGLLIADEATSALDTVVQARIVALLLRLCREDGMSLLFVTHDIALASQVADRIAVLGAGRVVEWGAARDVITAPAAPYTRALLAAHLPLDTADGAPA